MKKILIVNLSKPEETRYIDSDKVGTFFWGRRLSHYAVFFAEIDEENLNNSLKRIILNTPEITEIQKHIDAEIQA